MKQINDKEFSMNATTKEQYLKFKEEIKRKSHEHAFYIAYYIFKHRIGRDKETDLVDSQVIEKYIDDVVIPACYKGLYHGRIAPYCGETVLIMQLNILKRWLDGIIIHMQNHKMKNKYF